MSNEVQVFKVLGTVDDITDCDQCGRDDLKSTVALAELDADGNETGGILYMGSDCAAKAAGWTQTRVRAEVKAADAAKREAERVARQAAWDAETDRETAALIEWAAEVYGVHATTRDGVLDGVRKAAGLRTGTKVLIAFYDYQDQQAAETATEETEETMTDWAAMTPADFGHTTGTQLDMFAGLEGDGYGTLDLLDETPAAPVVDFPARTDGALFGLTSGPAVDGALFSVVAA